MSKTLIVVTCILALALMAFANEDISGVQSRLITNLIGLDMVEEDINKSEDIHTDIDKSEDMHVDDYNGISLSIDKKDDSDIEIILYQKAVDMNLSTFERIGTGDYNAFGNKVALQPENFSTAELYDKGYINIENKSDITQEDVIIELESDHIYFDSYSEKNELEQDIEYKLIDFVGQLGYEKLRLTFKEHIYGNTSIRISLNDLIVNNVKWFTKGIESEGYTDVPLKVTIASKNCKSKTFEVNLKVYTESNPS